MNTNRSLLTTETMSHVLDVAVGRVQGQSLLFLSGINENVDTPGNVDVWEPGGLYPFITTATTLRVVSSSANDTSAGTGARTILIQGLDSNYDEIEELVTLNGLTAVQTTSNFFRVNRSTVITVGSTSRNQGNITVRGGTLGTDPIVSYIKQGYGISHDAIYTVPNGKTLFLLTSIISLAKKQSSEGLITLETRAPGGAWITSSFINLTSEGSNSFVRPVPAVGSVEEKTDLKFRLVSTNVSDLTVSVNADFLIRNNDQARL